MVSKVHSFKIYFSHTNKFIFLLLQMDHGELVPTPNDFNCPISLVIMTDPVMTCDGYTFERDCIQSWFRKGKTTNPLTNLPLKNKQLIPNRNLKRLIQEFQLQLPRKEEEMLRKQQEEQMKALLFDTKVQLIRSSINRKNGQKINFPEITVFRVSFEEWKNQFQKYKETINQKHNEEDGVYVGFLKNGLKHGKGVKIYHDNTIQEGQFVEGKLNGKGVKIFPKGNRYEGQFKDGVFDGYGFYYFASGTIYEGSFKDNAFQGKGAKYFQNGNCQFGQWKKDKLNGYGVKFFQNGKKYEGQFMNDAFHGQGQYCFPSGIILRGNFVRNAFEGKGRKYYPNGDYFEGTFIKDREHGKGKMHKEFRVQDEVWENGVKIQ